MARNKTDYFGMGTSVLISGSVLEIRLTVQDLKNVFRNTSTNPTYRCNSEIKVQFSPV